MGFIFTKIFNSLFGGKDLRILILGKKIQKSNNFYYF